MRNKKRFVKSFLTKTMLWAAFATLNYNPAIAAEYTINNFNDLSSALNSGSFGDILNPSQLQTGDKVILGGSINADSSIEVAIDNVTINGGGGSSYVYSATGNSIDGLITGVGTNIETNIENINMQGFNNAIVVNSGNTLDFSNSALTGNETGILNNGTTNISNVSITDGITNNDTLNFSGNNNITDLNGKGAVSNSGNLILTNADVQGSYTQTSGSLSVIGETNFSDSKTNISGGGFAIGNTTGNTASATFNGTIEEGTQLTVNSGSTFTNTGNVTLNNNDTLNGSFKQSTGTLNLAGVKTNGKLNSTGGVVNVTGNQTLKDGDTIGSGANLTVGATLTNEGGTINLDNGDKIESAGSISQTSGVINADNFSTTESGGSLQASGGSLNISSGGLTLNNSNDSISSEVNATIGGDLTINNGSITLNTGDKLGKGTISQSGGNLTIIDISTGNSTLDANSGNLTLNGATLTGNDIIASDVNTTIGANGVTISNTSADGIILNNGDTINGTVNQQGGNLSLAGVTTNGKLNSTSGKLNITGDQTLTGGDTIGSGANLTVGATLTNNGGTINLNNGDKIESAGSISQTLGTIDANNFATAADGGSLKVNGGDVNITGDLTLNNANDNIADGATVNMDGNLTLNNGSVSLSSSDNLENGTIKTIKQTNGTLNLNGIKTGDINLNSTGGNLNLTNTTLNNSNDSISSEVNATIGGNLTIDNGSITLNTGDNLGNGTISQNGGSLTISEISTGNSTLDADSGNLTLNGATLTGNDTIISDVNTTIGVKGVNIQGTGTEGVTLTDQDRINGQIKQTGGILNLNNATMDGHLYSESGNLNIENSQNLVQGDYINTNTIVTLDGNLNVNGADVTINNNDTLTSGSMNLTNGILNLNNITTENVNINATGGTLQLSGVTLDNQEDNIEFGSNVTFGGDVNITKGNVEIDSDDTLTTGTITLNQADGATATLGVDGLKTDAVNLDLQKGTLNIINNGLELNNTSDVIQKEIITNVDGNLTINEGKVLLNEDDSWNSGIVSVSSNGKLQFENFEATSNSDTTLKMDGAGSVTELISSTVTFGNAENISDGTIAIDYDSGILIQSGSYNLSDMKTSGSISTINGGYENHTANTMTILNNTTPSVISNNDIAGDGFAAFGVDLYARNANKLQNSDVFKGTDLTLSDTNGTGEVYIADYVLNGKLNRSDAPIDRYYNFKIFDYENIDPNITISATDKETFTPIGYYRLFSNGDGSYTLGLTRYNKQVFRTQATTLAQYNNQLAIDDMVTSHHTLFGERKLAHASYNRFASATPNLGPYQYSQQDGGLWFKSYADLERLSMTQDLNVHNTAYGAIIGADFPIVNLKGGWKFIPTPYIGYNGAHQSFNDVSAYQTGGQLGFMGTFMKNHFISSHTIYGGGYYNEMHVDNVLDNTGNWFWGTAHRFAYNWNIKNHFIVQPTAFISYNMFGEQNLHSDFGDMGMKSGMLNGINIAPGINFIYAERDWSAYIGVQYMYNINEQVSGRAGNVYLPNLAMRHGYIQYGIGGTRNINDDLAAYAQVMFRNAGRTGVAFQLGLQYYFDIHEIGSKIKNGYNITLNKIKNIKKEK